jgi:predicted transcriptional regulator
MATYSVTTTAKQDTGLAAYRAEINADRATNGQAALTLAQVADALFGRMLAARADRADEDEKNTIREAWAAASAATKASIKTTLGL